MDIILRLEPTNCWFQGFLMNPFHGYLIFKNFCIWMSWEKNKKSQGWSLFWSRKAGWKPAHLIWMPNGGVTSPELYRLKNGLTKPGCRRAAPRTARAQVWCLWRLVEHSNDVLYFASLPPFSTDCSPTEQAILGEMVSCSGSSLPNLFFKHHA